MTLLKEFRQFAMQGNVIDLAVGVVIGAAFGKIVSSLVSDIIMPVLGMFVGGINFTEIKWVLREAVMNADGTVQMEALTLGIGNFIQVTFDFILVALAIFLFVVKPVNRMKAPAAPAAPPTPSKEEVLLSEIRDLLKK